MNYYNLYVNLLSKHGTKDKPNYYVEQHHILPKGLGGTNDKDNLVYLTPRAHFLSHWLLYKSFPCYSTARAFYGMCDINRRPERRYSFSSKQYQIAKEIFAKEQSILMKSRSNELSIKAKKQWEDNYEIMKESTAFMFKDENHPMYMKGKVGDLHPRSRAVITPLGRFGSVRQAGKAHFVVHNIISRRCKSKNYPDYYYEDGGN